MCMPHSTRVQAGGQGVKSLFFHLVGMGSVLVRVLIAATRHYGQKQNREERVDLAYVSILMFITE